MTSEIVTTIASRSLAEQRAEYMRRRFLAVPAAGAILWTLIGVAGATLRPELAVWAIWLGTGSIVYVGLFISRFTGENLLDKSRPKNEFDSLFYFTVAQALFVFSIAIPFFLTDYTSLPMTVGILTGLMWVPLTWAIKHWVGVFHTAVRTALILIAWYLFPDHRFVLIPAVIVAVYIVTIVILEKRWRAANRGS